jgi:hypothetical protein
MMEKSLRRRTQVSRTVKGVLTYEAVVETDNYTEEEHLKEQQSLVDKMERDYPFTGEK